MKLMALYLPTCPQPRAPQWASQWGEGAQRPPAWGPPPAPLRHLHGRKQALHPPRGATLSNTGWMNEGGLASAYTTGWWRPPAAFVCRGPCSFTPTSPLMLPSARAAHCASEEAGDQSGRRSSQGHTAGRQQSQQESSPGSPHPGQTPSRGNPVPVRAECGSLKAQPPP